MGKRGPRPAPTALKVVRGEWKGRVNDSEPIPGTGAVEPPEWLCDEALAVWDGLAGDLERTGVLTSWDVESFARWCDAVVRHREAARMLDEQSAVVKEPIVNRDGDVVGYRLKRNPWGLVWKQTDDIIARVGARFGLTPSDRSELKVDRHGDDDGDQAAYFSS